MDRKVLLAMVLIMGVLILDQMISPQFYRPKKPTPSQQGRGSQGGGGAGAAGTQASGKAPAESAAGTASQATTAAGGPGQGGTSALAPTRPDVPAAPVVVRTLRTDFFAATITSDGASIANWVVPAYKDEVRNGPVDLVPPGTRAYQVIVEAGGRALDFSQAPFRIVEDHAEQGALTLEARDAKGIRVERRYRVGSDPRILDTEIRVSAPAELGPVRYRLGWGTPLPITEPSTQPNQLQSVALLGTRLEHVTGSKKPAPERILSGNVRWVANRSKYFIAAVIPDSGTVSEVAFQSEGGGVTTAWLQGSASPGSEVMRHARVYGGPIHYETLAAIGAGLDEVANMGWRWMRGISVLLLKCLNALYKAIPNYGVAIIILAAGTKFLFYPLTQSSLRSMKIMHHLQPQIKEMQERYKNDPMKLNSAMMALYKEHKVNPMSGCLPMLLQVPVFFGLYSILLNSIELRASGFVGYIRDLSAPDVLMSISGFPVHLMPIVMTVSTYLLQSQTPVAPAQRGTMYVMPLVMLFIMYSFPSGVVLYWTVNNLLSALQQYLVNLAEDRRLASSG